MESFKPLVFMVVEDNCIIAEDIRCLLKSFPLSTVYMFDSGKVFLKHFGGIKPDVVIMDINICGIYDGIETAIHIRLESEVPILFVSASTYTENLNRINRITNSYLLRKPFDGQILKERINHILSHRFLLHSHLDTVNKQIPTRLCVSQ